MVKSIARCSIGCVVLFALNAHAQVLFDGALGLPATQGWFFFATGGSQSLVSGAAHLDTSSANAYQGGYTITAPTALDHTNGFTLAFTLQVLEEAHLSNDRAGFSVILLSNDKHGIELGFWSDKIFAQSDSPLFTHAEDTNYPAAGAFVDYALTLRRTSYVLQANGTAILSGPIRDYEAFSGFPNPYTVPNDIFFGDDTTSAGGAFALKKVVLVTAPALTAGENGRIAWTGVAGQTYTVLSSTNLADWIPAQTVTSATTSFAFTNTATASARFFRVSYP